MTDRPKGFATFLATGFGVGRIPFAPGTFASAATLPLGWFLIFIGWKALLLVAFAVASIGIWSCGKHAKSTGLYDPSECVLDEVAGQLLALLPIAIEARGDEWRPLVLAFFLFRLFDITKPWPVSAAENLPGGFGIMMDDVIAGLFAAVFVYVALFIRLV